VGALLTPVLGAADEAAKAKKPAMSSDMQRAIAWERFKDLAAARQARLEAIHPSVPAPSADRSADRSIDQPDAGKAVKDPGPGKQKNPDRK
jgi:hypothetical protein